MFMYYCMHLTWMWETYFLYKERFLVWIDNIIVLFSIIETTNWWTSIVVLILSAPCITVLIISYNSRCIIKWRTTYINKQSEDNGYNRADSIWDVVFSYHDRLAVYIESKIYIIFSFITVEDTVLKNMRCDVLNVPSIV